MAYGIKLHVQGEFACFTRPEMKVERVSYDVMTPSAAAMRVETIPWPAFSSMTRKPANNATLGVQAKPSRIPGHVRTRRPSICRSVTGIGSTGGVLGRDKMRN